MRDRLHRRKFSATAVLGFLSVLSVGLITLPTAVEASPAYHVWLASPFPSGTPLSGVLKSAATGCGSSVFNTTKGNAYLPAGSVFDNSSVSLRTCGSASGKATFDGIIGITNLSFTWPGHHANSKDVTCWWNLRMAINATALPAAGSPSGTLRANARVFLFLVFSQGSSIVRTYRILAGQAMETNGTHTSIVNRTESIGRGGSNRLGVLPGANYTISAYFEIELVVYASDLTTSGGLALASVSMGTKGSQLLSIDIGR